MNLVELEDVVKDYRLGKAIIPALRGVSLAIERGEFLCIAGPSGSGKTTLLNLIGCLDRPTSGVVRLEGKDVTSLSAHELALTRRRVGHLLESVDLEEVARHRPDELSGGQQQRVAVARALVTEPALVLADEPTANLDSATGEEIIELMHGINREQGTTFVFSTHDPQVMERASRAVRLRDGRLDLDGE